MFIKFDGKQLKLVEMELVVQKDAVEVLTHRNEETRIRLQFQSNVIKIPDVKITRSNFKLAAASDFA